MVLAFTPEGFNPTDFPGVPEDVARRVLLRARTVEPRILTIVEGDARKRDILAVLRFVAKRAMDIGTGVVASQGRNGTSISFRDVRSAFWPEDVQSLRDVFDLGKTPAPGLPRGSFPTERPLAKVWPEGDYS